MMLAALAFSVLMLADVPSTEDLASLHAAEAKAGRDADAHVKIALWCEAKGMTSERAKHLAMAVAADPSHAVARGLMGLVLDGGKWRKPDHVADRAKADADGAKALADYEIRRRLAAPTADAQWKLAQWCDTHDLKLQAEAHARATIRIDPSRKAAWERLGYKNRNGRWVTDDEVAAARREAEAQDRADRIWRPRLVQWRADFRIASKRPLAEDQMAKVTDARAVPSIIAVFATADPRDQEKLVQMLGQIDGGPASRFLAFASLFGDSVEVRRAAAETLARRDPRDFVVDLIGQIRDILKYQVQPVDGPGSMGVLVVEGERYNVRRRYATPSLPEMAQRFIVQRETGFYAGSDFDMAMQDRQADARTRAKEYKLFLGDPVALVLARRDAMIAADVSEVQRAAAATEAQLEQDITQIDAVNRTSRQLNDRVLGVLGATTGGDLGPDRLAWAKWWTDRQGYAFVSSTRTTDPKPTLDVEAPVAYTAQFVSRDMLPPGVTHACFAAGTPVRTRDGMKPIETLSVGDLVLSQDVIGGKLAFEPIVAVYHNPPASTVEVRLDDDAIVATGIHRFWSAGKGWTMARDLKPGDRVRVVGGTRRVEAVEPQSVQPVFNLEVARGRSFFVGKGGALVHDNSLVETTPEPFDRTRD
jgi:Pretoxin HINT domain